MPLQDELRELFTKVGPQVFEDADTFRGAFDDFVPEGAATAGERRLLVDAIATGSFQRLVTQLGIDADPGTAIAAEATRLARDRGTVETDGARWALSALAFARGLTDEGSVTTRPSALGNPAAPEPEDAAAYAPTITVDDAQRTEVAPQPPAPPPAQPPVQPPAQGTGAVAAAADPSPSRSGRSRLVVVGAVLAILVVAAVALIVLLGDRDDEGGREAQDSADTADTADTADDADAGFFPEPPSDLPALPVGYPETFEFDVRLPGELTPTVKESFGEGISTEIFSGGDPTSPEVLAEDGPQPTAARVGELVAAGIPPRVKFYSLRQVGQEGGEASGGDLLDLLQATDEMTAYWSNVRALLTELGALGAPVEVIPEPDLPGEVLSSTPDATSVPMAVSATGVEGLAGLPDTFAGWAQAWTTLRDELAPQVRLGLTVSPWQIQDDLLPNPPATAQVEAWAATFGDSYATLGARFDFLDTILTYVEGGSQGDEYLADDRFFDRLLTWVDGISTATDTRVVIDNVPVGNTVYRTVDDSEYHYRDTWVEWILGDDDFTNLLALRDAGVIGIVFGVDGAPASITCPCDAAGDGVTNGGDHGLTSSSADDDGGYLAERLRAYAETGGLPL